MMTNSAMSGVNYSVQVDQIEIFDAMAQLQPATNSWEFTYRATMWYDDSPHLKTVGIEELDVHHELEMLLQDLVSHEATERFEMLVVSPVMFAQKILTFDNFQEDRFCEKPCILDFELVSIGATVFPLRIAPLAKRIKATDWRGYPVI
jgi:hypothetical protein